MGVLFIEGTVTGPNAHSRLVRFMLDSGVRDALLPEAVWQDLGLEPQATRQFKLSDGSTTERAVSKCKITLLEEEFNLPVTLGAAGDEAVLGTKILKCLGLALDPFQRKLKPIKPHPR